jgi:hypothetical protein
LVPIGRQHLAQPSADERDERVGEIPVGNPSDIVLAEDVSLHGAGA